MTNFYVDEIMSRPAKTVTPDTPIRDAADEMIRNDVGAVVVVNENVQVEGIVTSTDLVLLVRDGAQSSDSTVAESMRTDVKTTTRSTLVSEIANTMLEDRIHHMPVIDGEEVVGMVSTFDLTAYLARSLGP